MSRGTPTKAASSPSGEACTGSRIMEQTPTGRATNSELGGWFRGASEAWRSRLRPGLWSPETGREPPPPQRDASSRSMPPIPSLLDGWSPQCPGHVCQRPSCPGLKGQGCSGDQGWGRGPRDPAARSPHLCVDFGPWLLSSVEPGAGFPLRPTLAVQ